MATPIVSNLNAYLAIATAALESSKRIEAAQTRPKPDGSPGSILTWDPTQASFKQSLIAIVFAGVYLDALLYIAIRERFGLGEFEKLNRRGRRPRYKLYLEKLEITDPEILAGCARFNDARNDIVHEKALEIGAGNVEELHIAQREADNAVTFVHRVAELLKSRLMSEQSGRNAQQ